MRIKLFNAKVLGAALVVAALASCSELQMPEGEIIPQDPAGTPTESTFYTAALKTVASSSDRVVMAPRTRADEGARPGSLSLLATIENPSRQNDFANFEREGRYLSATCVYFDRSSGTYYATYHMQGNNYNTDQTVETAGLVETFTVAADGTPALGSIYRSEDPAQFDFDFNHLYFDEIPSPSPYVGDYNIDDDSGVRVIAGGHISEPTKDGTGTNTAAVIGKLNLSSGTPSFDYKIVYTGDKILDADGHSLGNENAFDVNCFVRKYNHYYLATRKGIAVLKAGKDEMFEPEVDANGHAYFLKTPGSAKYISQPTTTSYIDFLYLTQEPEQLSAEAAVPAKAARFAISTQDNKDWFLNVNAVEQFSWDTESDWNNGSTWPRMSALIETVSPVDGKNMLATYSLNTAAIYACLGKGGLYVHNPTYGYNYNHRIITFSDAKEGGSRPVNGVYVEDWDVVDQSHATDGFIYVANGACLTILDAFTLETVAEYSAFKEGDASANFVHVVRTGEYTNQTAPDRIITVAYGQAGVKVFKFVPPTRK